MARTCPHCGTSLSNKLFVCDVCHSPLPQIKKEYVTATYDALKPSLKLVSLKSRKLAAFLFLLFGFTGIGFFYLSFIRRGFIYLLLNASVVGFVYFFYPDFLMTTIGSILGLQVMIALVILLRFTIKDHRGELLK